MHDDSILSASGQNQNQITAVDSRTCLGHHANSGEKSIQNIGFFLPWMFPDGFGAKSLQIDCSCVGGCYATIFAASAQETKQGLRLQVPGTIVVS